MKVVHVISGLGMAGGGTSAAVAGLAMAQARAGLDVSVVSTFLGRFEADNRLQAERLRAAGVAVSLIGPARGSLVRHEQIPLVLDEVEREADVVHIHAVWEEIQYEAAKTAKRHGLPYIVTPHGMLSSWSYGQRRWKKALYMLFRMRPRLNAAAAIHFMSPVERDLTAFHQLRAPVLVEPIGVSLEEFVGLPPRGSFRAQYPALAGRPIVAFLGRIHPGKGLEYLIPAMAVTRRSTNAALVVGGPDSTGYRAHIEGLIARHGLKDDVIFTGMLNGVERIAMLADADLMCLPSDHENFGVVVIESLAAGTPVILSPHVALHRMVTEAGVGATVSQDAQALGAELSRWLCDDALRSAAAERARPYVWKNYDWQAIGRRWIGHYDRFGRRPKGQRA